MAFFIHLCNVFLVVLAAVCIQFHEAQFIPGARCLCPTTVKKVSDTITNFTVYEKGPGCNKRELIVTTDNNSTDNNRLCLDTEGRLALAFLTCWEKINKDENQKITCLNRRKKSQQQQ